jgi:tetratricopeptide (TPR) repeat protein
VLAHILGGEVGAAGRLLDTTRMVLSAESPPLVTGRTHYLVAQLRWHSGRYAASLDAAERALAAARSSGDHAAVEASAQVTLERAESTGNVRAMAVCQHALGSVHFLMGRWTACSEELERNVRLARSVGAGQGEVIGSQRLGLLETAVGRFDEAHSRLRATVATARASQSFQVRHHSFTRTFAALAQNRLQVGDLGAAVEYLEEGTSILQETGECITCDGLIHPVAVPIYLATGDAQRAEAACDLAEQLVVSFRSRARAAGARHVRGLLAAKSGDLPLARTCLTAAVATFDELGQPYDAACSPRDAGLRPLCNGRSHSARAGHLRLHRRRIRSRPAVAEPGLTEEHSENGRGPNVTVACIGTSPIREHREAGRCRSTWMYTTKLRGPRHKTWPKPTPKTSRSRRHMAFATSNTGTTRPADASSASLKGQIARRSTASTACLTAFPQTRSSRSRRDREFLGLMISDGEPTRQRPRTANQDSRESAEFTRGFRSF